MVKKCLEFAPNGKILDYGCGRAEIVEEGLKQDLDIVGVEAFYEGNQSKKVVKQKGLLNSFVFPLGTNFEIPFPPDTFDLIISNQVLEHVEDIDYTLKEIQRVLKSTGTFITIFPHLSVWREGHCGIPFSHWFNSRSPSRYPYMRFLRLLGFGYNKAGKTSLEWVKFYMNYLDKFTYYRKLPVIHKAFLRNNFTFKSNEINYMKYRLEAKNIRLHKIIANNTLFQKLLLLLYRVLGGVTFICHKS
jgi:ubiquinone/menaquinone biosynthesis C-methylase UbiE